MKPKFCLCISCVNSFSSSSLLANLSICCSSYKFRIPYVCDFLEIFYDLWAEDKVVELGVVDDGVVTVEAVEENGQEEVEQHVVADEDPEGQVEDYQHGVYPGFQPLVHYRIPTLTCGVKNIFCDF